MPCGGKKALTGETNVSRNWKGFCFNPKQEQGCSLTGGELEAKGSHIPPPLLEQGKLNIDTNSRKIQIIKQYHSKVEVNSSEQIYNQVPQLPGKPTQPRSSQEVSPGWEIPLLETITLSGSAQGN